jgi:hypothetical protein
LLKAWFPLGIQQISLYLSKKTKKTRKTNEKQAFLKSQPGKPAKTNAFALLFAESMVSTRYSTNIFVFVDKKTKKTRKTREKQDF